MHSRVRPPRTRWRFIAAAGILLAASVMALLNVARATPASKFAVTVLADGVLPAGARFTASRPAVEIDRLSLKPGGFSGWHSHPGPVMLIVQRGTLSNYRVRHGRCSRFRLGPGQVLLESPGDFHFARNVGTRTAVAVAVVNYPKGGETAHDAPRHAACRA